MAEHWTSLKHAVSTTHKFGQRVDTDNVVGSLARDSGAEEETWARCIQHGIACLGREGKATSGGNRIVSFQFEGGTDCILEEISPASFSKVRDAFDIDRQEYQAILTSPGAKTNMRYIDL